LDPSTFLKNNAPAVVCEQALSPIIEQIEVEGCASRWLLPGGRSVLPVVEYLNKRICAEGVLTKARFFQLDERAVEESSPERNFPALKEAFSSALSEKKLRPEQLVPIRCWEQDLEQEGKRYTESLRSHGAQVQISVLGIGEDGHFASLFPAHSALEVSAETYLVVENAPKPPPRRLSASLPLVSSSTHMLALFFGEGKRAALEKFKQQSAPTTEVPLSFLADKSELTVLTDLDDSNE